MSEMRNGMETAASVSAEKPIDVSVIIPVYNVEEFLRPCLDSLLHQGDISLEVLMIDDGTPDSSGEIIDEYAEKYDGFVAFHKENGGLGNTRNYGVERARGKYLFFLDSDDVLVDGILGRLFHAAENNGTEIAVCNVARFNSQKRWKSDIQERAFQNYRPVMHITRDHQLIYDTISCNKLILRSFFLKHGFKFPEKILYEDIPVVIPMMILANGASMIAQPGYLWRVRDGNNKSITQRSSAMDNLRDRLKIVRMLDDFFAKNVTDEGLIRAKMKKILEIDLKIFANNCNKMPEDQALEVFRLVNEYIDEAIDKSVFRELSILDQQKYEYIRTGNVQSYIELLEYQRTKYSEAPVTETESGLTVKLPDELFTIPQRDITKEFAGQVRRTYVDKVVTHDDSFEIYGHLYIRRYSMASEGDQQVEAFLVNEEHNLQIPLEVTPWKTEFLTDNFGTITDKDTGEQTSYNYDNAGFLAVVDLKKLADQKAPGGVYTVVLYYKDRRFSGDTVLSGVDSVIRGKCQNIARIVGSLSATIHFGFLNQLRILVETDKLIADTLTYEDGAIVCSLNRSVPSLLVPGESAYDDRDAWISLDRGEDGAYRLPVAQLEEGEEYWFEAPADPDAPPAGSVAWTGIFGADGAPGGFTQPVYERKQSIRILSDDRGAVIFSSARTGLPKVWFQKYAFVVTCAWQDKDCLCMDVFLKGDPTAFNRRKKVRLYVEDSIANTETILAESEISPAGDGLKCYFRVDFSDDELTKNFYAGTRYLKVRFTRTDGETGSALLYCDTDLFYTFIQRRETLRIFCYQSMFGTVRMQLVRIWPDAESSLNKRQALITENYPKFREEPIQEKTILFDSMWGTKYSCNPQAIYEYIDAKYPEYKCVWNFTDERTPIKGRGIRVRRDSLEYYHYMATAKYFISNVNMPDDFVKRPGQIGIQTMHGTPLKTLGLDAEGEFESDIARERFIERNANWDYIISQGRFVEEKAAAIYGVEREILPTGYPRTDKLYHAGRFRLRKIKKQLGIPLKKKVLLYTPTWRVMKKFDLKLDLEMMREKLGDEYVLLVRLHHLATECDIPEDKQFIFDMTSYQYVEDLYLISDILITDYSSVMFDFALLDRPMVFFTYDLKEYTEKLRGLYVDFEKESPGPLAFDTEQVIHDILNIREISARYQERVKAFIDKYLTYENGNSNKMIVKKVFKAGR